MAATTVKFNNGLLRLLDRTIDPLNDTMKLLIVASGYTFDKEHDFVNDITNEVTNKTGSGYERKTLSGLSWNLTSVFSVSGITRSGTTVTVTTSSAHGYKVGEEVVIEGADQSDYNGRHEITVVPSTTTFEYEIATSPTTPATGTITASLDLVYLDAANPTYTAIDTNEDLSRAIIYKEVTDDTDSILFGMVDFPDLSTNGSDIELQMPDRGIFKYKNKTE